MSTAASVPAVVTLGETMALVRTTELGSLRHASNLHLGVGGAESNVAIGLQRLGTAVSWIGRVGDDSLGERVARELRAEGITVRAVADPGAATGLMVKERPSSTSTAVHYYRAGSAGSRIEPADLPDGWIEGADLLHLTGITPLLSASARETVHAAIDRAKDAGTTVTFDVNYRSRLAAVDDARPVLREIAERADVVFGGADELVLLFPGSDAAGAASRLLDGGARQVVLKDGAAGATLFDGGDPVIAPGFVIDVVDTVGAGDAFVAGYLDGMLRGLAPADVLRQANACGAIACLTPGDWEAAPTRRELARFLDGGGGDPVVR